MKLKNIGKKFQENFRGKQEENIPKELFQKEVIGPIQDKDLTVAEQAERIIGILQEYPEHRDAIVKRVVEAKEIPQAAVDKSAVIAADSPEVSDDIAATLAKEASDKSTLYVLKEAEISANAGIEIKETLDKEKSKEEADCILLRKLYNSLKKVGRQEDLADKIQKILEESERTDKINKELYKVIAKNFAIVYHDLNGAMSIYSMEKIVPLDEMLRVNMPQKIEEEYIDLLDDDEENRFDKDQVTNIFLERLAKEATDEANKQGKSIELFLPTNIGTLSEDQIENYLNFLGKYNPSLTDLARGSIRDKLNGKEQEEYSVDKFINSVMELPDEQGKRYLSILSKLTPKEMDTLAQCIESGNIGNLSKKKPKERREYFKTINASIEKRREKKDKNDQIPENNVGDEEIQL